MARRGSHLTLVGADQRSQPTACGPPNYAGTRMRLSEITWRAVDGSDWNPNRIHQRLIQWINQPLVSQRQDQIRSLISDDLRDHGFLDPKVTITTKRLGGDRARLEVLVDPGETSIRGDIYHRK